MQQRSTTQTRELPIMPMPRAKRSRVGLIGCALLLDAAMIWLAFCTAYALRYLARWVPIIDRGTLPTPFKDWTPFGLLLSCTVLASLIANGLYRSLLGRDLIDEIQVIVRSTLVAVGIVVIVNSFLPVVQYSHLVIIYAWLLLLLYLSLGRTLFSIALNWLHEGGWNTRRVLVVGATPIGKMVMQNMLAKRNRGYHLLGFLQDGQPTERTPLVAIGNTTNVTTASEMQQSAPGYPNAGPNGVSGSYPRPVFANFGRFHCLGCIEDLDTVIQEWAVDEVIVALPATHHSEIAEVRAHCDGAQVAVKMVPDLFELSLSQVRMDHLAGIPLIDVRRGGHSGAALAIKRSMDIIISSLLLLILSPILLLTAICIKLDSPGPVIKRQTRVGKGNKEFTFLKFRSMYVDADQRVKEILPPQGATDPKIFKMRNDPRRTKVGRVIRQFSIDELPQLINVLRGDMSLVGPRPPLPHEVANYEPHHFKRLQVVGGMTGMWQVSGRSNIESFEEIIIMDTYYIDNWSLGLDLKILLRTIVAVVTRNGAY